MNIFEQKPNTSKFRIPQKDGYEATLKHFSEKNAKKHVLIQIPTGVGKTALISVLPFGLSKKKVLILTPSLNLSTQMEDDLDITSNEPPSVYKNLNILNNLEELELFVLRLEKTASSVDIDESHIIISNYQQLADVEKWFKDRSGDIDLIIIDEAHHQEAKTYKDIIKFFPEAKVISLTATPFRTDGQKLDGKKIYTYHFSDAVKKGYISNIQTVNITPSEVLLEFDDENGKKYSLDEIMKMKEESWFRNGIATSQDCCNSIAQKSIEMLNKLKSDFPNEDHQIIATAMSVREARERVKKAFERLGLRVGLISSKHMKTNDAQKKKLRQGKIDVIINVNMLGEGFDHKPLGVASIFKPFASLNPYIQFIGRVIRTNNKVDLCYVVSHLGLNQTERFKEFRLFDSDDKGFLNKQLLPNCQGTKDIPDEDELLVKEQEKENRMTVIELGDTILEFEDKFVNVEKIQKARDLLDDLSDEERNILSEFGYKISKSKKDKVIKPKDKRRAEKNNLKEKENSIATDIINDLGLQMYGRNFNPRQRNFVWVKSQISRDVNKRLGIGKNQRNNLTYVQINNFLNSDEPEKIHRERMVFYKKKLEEKKK